MKKYVVKFHDEDGRFQVLTVDAQDAQDTTEVLGNYRNVVTFYQVPDDAHTATFVCSRCGKVSLKELWGPGRVRCPRCNEIERSAAESQDEELLDASAPGRL